MTSPHAPAGIDPDTFFVRPDVFPLEFGNGRLDLVPMTPETYRRSIFTDRGRIVPAGSAGWQAGIDAVLGEFERRAVPQPAVHYIFHIAHCGSTLLSRAMDIPDRTLVVREPFILRQLGADAARTATPPAPLWRRCLNLGAALLGRRYSADQPVVVKANVPVNFIIDDLMTLNPSSSGVLLYAPLERYLLSVLKTPMHRRWVDNVTGQLAAGIAAELGAATADLSGLTTAERAGCLWFAQMRLYQGALARHERLRSLDCERFFADPAATLTAGLRLAGDDPDEAAIAGIVDGDLFRRHAKDPGRAFDAGSREEEMKALAGQLAPEVERATRLVARVAADKPVELPLPSALF